MIKEEQKNMLTGILGTIAFHLLLLVLFLLAKLGEVKTKHQDLITIEFTEEEYKSIEEIIEENKPIREKITPLSNQIMSNIASNVADQMNKQVSTDKYIEEIMKELEIEEMNPVYDNILPDDPSLSDNNDRQDEKEVKTNFGQTRITYNVPPNRKARYVDRPIYKCQSGGEVIVAIAVNQTGEVIQASVKSSTTSETCIIETAVESARNFLFKRDYSADKRVDGTITYIFVAQ